MFYAIKCTDLVLGSLDGSLAVWIQLLKLKSVPGLGQIHVSAI